MQIFQGTNGWRTLIACWPKCMQQLTGLTLVNSYATYFFSLAGNKDAFLVTVILAYVSPEDAVTRKPLHGKFD